jgi:hypothetical protein
MSWPSPIGKEKDSLISKKNKVSQKTINRQLSQFNSLKGLKTGFGIKGKGNSETRAFKKFPKLDRSFKKSDFSIATSKAAPEFTQDYIAAHFSNSPKADTLVAQAARAFEALEKLGNFVDVITGSELLQLPVGLSKKDSTSGNTVQLAITQVKMHPKYAELKAWAKMTIPEKGEDANGTKDLFFGAEGIKFSHDGALIGDMKLVLLGNQAIPFNGDSWLLTLKGGVNLKTGDFINTSFAVFDCTGLKEIGLAGDLRVSRNVLLPLDANGDYLCGELPDATSEGGNANPLCYVNSSFQIEAGGWNDILLEIDLPPFEITGFPGWGFQLEKSVLDLSDTRKAEGLTFPAEYQVTYPSGSENLWRGVYASSVVVTLPKGIEDTGEQDKRVRFGAQNLVLDAQGVSGSFYGSNVLKQGDGAAGKWSFTVDSVGVSLAMNRLKGGYIGGAIGVPILETPLSYEGWVAPKEYGLNVKLDSSYAAPMFLGEMQLEPNSSVAIKVLDDKVYPYANLTGKLNIAGKIGQKQESSDQETNSKEGDGSFGMKGIVFEELEIQTEPGKKPLQAKSFGFTGEMDLMFFPASISDLQLITPTDNTAGLSFDLAIHLDKDGSHAATHLNILGQLDNESAFDTWKFESVKVDGIELEYEKGGMALKGSLQLMNDDPVYGNGFEGDLTLTIEKLDMVTSGKAMFGAKDFRYWFVDVWSDSVEKEVNSNLPLQSFVGGASYHMRKVSGNSNGFTPSNAVYEPDAKIGLGLKAGVRISAKNEEAFTGKAFLEMVYNTHGGLNRIGFIGQGSFMGKSKGITQGAAEMGALKGVMDKVNDFYEKNKEKAEKLAASSNFLGMAKESQPKEEVAQNGKIGVYVGIEKNFEADTFDGQFEVYMDTKGLRGGGPDNLVGRAVIHSGPSDWYLHIGTPKQRLSLVFAVPPEEFEVGGYFMTGTQLPTQLDPDPMVLKILGPDILDKNRNTTQLEAARGFAFGLSFKYRKKYEYLIFYATLEAGAGFDVMHAYYPNARCKGKTGPVGNDGWYSTGQVYAYLYGEFGVKVDLLFIKGNYKIAEAGVAAMLRGQFPNPAYFEGHVGMYYNILGGLVKGRLRLKIAMGEECELENIGNPVGVPMIADVVPRDKKDDVSVFAAPQAIFNYAANSEFDVNLEGVERTFRLQLKKFEVRSEGKDLAGKLEWNETGDAVTFIATETLPSEKEVQLVVEVSFEEKVNGAFRTMLENGKPITEKREVRFKTDKAPNYIPWENVAYSYPLPNQGQFYPEEYKKGYIKLKTQQNYLFDEGYQIRAQFVPRNGEGVRTPVTYDRSKNLIHFDLPEMILETPYNLDLLVFPPGKEIKPQISIEETDAISDTDAGDTNWFDPSGGAQTTSSGSASATVSNKKASGVTISGFSPKSILDYSFTTSEHHSFGDKVRSLRVTNYLTNFITSDVHSMSVRVEHYEYLDKMEILGHKYSDGKPLVYAQGLLKDAYYKRKIYPLLYEKYPMEGITVNRDVSVFGVPPVRSFYIGNEYLANYDNPSSSWVVNRIPFVHDLTRQYKRDFVHFRNSLATQYSRGVGPNIYDKYPDLMLRAFPPLPLGEYKTELIYRTPGGIHEKGYPLSYKND